MLKHRKFCPKKGKTLSSERGQTREEVAQRGCAVSVLGDIQTQVDVTTSNLRLLAPLEQGARTPLQPALLCEDLAGASGTGYGAKQKRAEKQVLRRGCALGRAGAPPGGD